MLRIYFCALSETTRRCYKKMRSSKNFCNILLGVSLISTLYIKPILNTLRFLVFFYVCNSIL
jgi:hypothetical protein